MTTLQLKHMSTAYDDTGSGFPCVFIHGTPFNRSMWNDQRHALANQYRVITPDLRGYGESSVIAGKTLLEDFARDLAELLDALNIEQIILGGLSMGGQIALEFYHLFPDRVKGLILADTFAQLDTPEGRAKRAETADRVLREGMRSYAEEVLSKMVCGVTLKERPAVAAHVMEMMQTTNPVGAAAAMLGRSERRDYVPMLSTISVPTIIVVGREDEFTPISDAEFMRDRIPNSQLVIIDQAGHMPNMERPDQFNQLLLTFCDRVQSLTIESAAIGSQRND